MPRNKTLMKSAGSARTGIGMSRTVGGNRIVGGGSGTSISNNNGTTNKKIVIKPFSKPPSLPPNYYESTTKELLDGTLAVLEHQVQQQQSRRGGGVSNGAGDSSGSGSSSSISMKSKSEILSLQHSYTAVVHLVRHQYGPMLYHDLKSSMSKAAKLVLPGDPISGSVAAGENDAGMSNSMAGNVSSTGGGGGGGSIKGAGGTGSTGVVVAAMMGRNQETLQYVNAQYQVYLEYLLLCKHVFLPLDNSQLSWTPQALAKAAQKAGQQQQQQQLRTVWQVGLEQFGLRLQELGLDRVLYREWMDAFLNDWSGGGNGGGMMHSSGAIGGSTSASQTTGNDLQSTWYLWQDLNWLSNLPLQTDLEDYWRKVSYQWKEEDAVAAAAGPTSSSSSCYYRASQFLQFAYDKHVRVTSWPWLPSLWLWSILEQCLIAPHLTSDYLLKKEHLHPILSDELHHLKQLRDTTATTSTTTTATTSSGVGTTAGLSKVSSAALAATAAPTAPANHPGAVGVVGSGAGIGASTALTPTQKLWMLAGRLPNGQQQVASAIADFARVQGLQKMSLMMPQQQQQQQQQQQGVAGGSGTQQRKAAPPSAAATLAISTQVVNELLELQEGLSLLLTTLPHGNELVHLKNTWEEVVNVDTQPSLAESLAKFLDQLLRSNKRMDMYQSKSPDQWLQRIISGLFVPIQAKDVFEAFYKRDLAKRLLLNRVVSMDIEKQVCSLLKAECGAGYTSKMEGMFQDIDWSRETMLVYKQATSSFTPSPSSVEMEVQVLTTGYWPVYPQYPNLILPDSFQEPQDRFETHYKTKYQGRRMTWQYALGTCIVRSNGFNKPYDFVVGLCQALVLIQFTESSTVCTLPALMKAVGLTDRDEMERILLSLSLGKDGTRILRKLDFDRDNNKKKKPRSTVDDKDEFCINTSFESNQRRIRINNIMMKETKEEREKTVEGVSRDRLYLIDAVLVRIMKARKTISHQALIPQVLEQVKVPAQPADVKKRIESLIEREYMERDAKDRNRYNYLA